MAYRNSGYTFTLLEKNINIFNNSKGFSLKYLDSNFHILIFAPNEISVATFKQLDRLNEQLDRFIVVLLSPRSSDLTKKKGFHCFTDNDFNVT